MFERVGYGPEYGLIGFSSNHSFGGNLKDAAVIELCVVASSLRRSFDPDMCVKAAALPLPQ